MNDWISASTKTDKSVKFSCEFLFLFVFFWCTKPQRSQEMGPREKTTLTDWTSKWVSKTEKFSHFCVSFYMRAMQTPMYITSWKKWYDLSWNLKNHTVQSSFTRNLQTSRTDTHFYIVAKSSYKQQEENKLFTKRSDITQIENDLLHVSFCSFTFFSFFFHFLASVIKRVCE